MWDSARSSPACSTIGACQVIRLPGGYERVTLIPMGSPAKVGSASKRRAVS